MESSRSAQRAIIQFFRTEEEHASQIYSRMKEVYGEQCLARCTIFRWCQRYEAGPVNIKDLPRPVAGARCDHDFGCGLAHTAESSDHYT
ncbi:hypothetical protein AVEN_205188-1 [Araneus ventricosus]|uniref:Mos1 transposase HTH domain-containing protein n=1 Tax=Araneus ventricosus TaxID=182803 RepID=A0A4Y2SV02_ARAVE|nr:hypothetical protein AVEN_205188-1 [Araneus ventricosus]